MGKTYIGVGDTAQQSKKIYLGVNDIAKKVKKAYVGVNGVARQVYKSNAMPRLFACSTNSYAPRGLHYSDSKLPLPDKLTSFDDGVNEIFNTVDSLNLVVHYGCIFKGNFICSGSYGANNTTENPIYCVNEDWENIGNVNPVMQPVSGSYVNTCLGFAHNDNICLALYRSTPSSSNAHTYIYYSYDGLTWNESKYIGHCRVHTQSLHYVNGLFYFFGIGNNGDNRCYTSSDGLVWTAYTPSFLGNYNSYPEVPYDIIYHNGYYYMTTSNFKASYSAYKTIVNLYMGETPSYMTKIMNITEHPNANHGDNRWFGNLNVCNGRLFSGADMYTENGVNWYSTKVDRTVLSGLVVEDNGSVWFENGYYYIFATTSDGTSSLLATTQTLGETPTYFKVTPATDTIILTE